MEISRGMRDKVDKFLSIDQDFEVSMIVNGKDEYDYSCFGVDNNDKLSDDRYMVFYIQEKSPEDEIKYFRKANTARFIINLSKLPAKINKLVFTVSVEGNGTMGAIQSHAVAIRQDNQTLVSSNLMELISKLKKQLCQLSSIEKENGALMPSPEGLMVDWVIYCVPLVK